MSAETNDRAAPESMRETVRDYVRGVHASYLDQARQVPPGERAALPLVGATGITVAAAAARRLHLVATTTTLPPPVGPEVETTDEYETTRWSVRFFDPSILPELGTLPDDTPAEVRRVLGIENTLYHLTVDTGGGLTGHHAQHSGVALANQHTKTSRELDRVRHTLPQRERAVDELGTCARLGLDRAAALLAADLTGGRVTPESGTSADDCLEAVLMDVTNT